ncbi:MAG: hypothetical protein BYD32DRAFT_432338 [Podila humilis]|nr:MAG: hypothetical protein BYD32DRAFT_432338 [Podila humilis]
MHKQQGDTGKKFVDDDDDVIYIPAKDGDTNTIPELDIKATAVQNPNHTYLVDEDTTDEYDIYETKEDIIFLNHMMRLCGTLCWGWDPSPKVEFQPPKLSPKSLC